MPDNRRAAAHCPDVLRLALAAQDPRHFALAETDEVLTIEIGTDRLEELRNNILGITRGEGDIAMIADGKRRPRDQALWFWWLAAKQSK
jgi:hypothetical protein